MKNGTRNRPPAVPLIAVDPYLSIWSFSDALNADATRHWTGAAHNMTGILRIDSVSYAVCASACGDEGKIPNLPQTDLQITPTQTCYTFEGYGVRLLLTFTTPSLPHDLDALGMPVTYLTFEVCSTDTIAHDVSLYWDIGAELTCNTIYEQVDWGRLQIKGLDALRIGSADQRPLGKYGDDLRIDWGYAYLTIPSGSGHTHLGGRNTAHRHFIRYGTLPDNDSTESPAQILRKWPSMAATFNFGTVNTTPQKRHLSVAYDDVYSIEFLQRKLRPWWRRNGATASDMLQQAESDYERLCLECTAYDADLLEKLEACADKDYAQLCALAFRQCLSAHKLAADVDGTPLYFSKENFSNGCIATVDVTYPSSPFFLALNPMLLQAQLDPILCYAESAAWKFRFAPHDLGTYPLANGQVYGGGEQTEENQMPVEECGNMLILVGALCLQGRREDYARRWWHLLTQWATYLEEMGMAPGNQLCTDDFAGHLAHNANLSLKAIIALGCYAKLSALIGENETAERTEALAKRMAIQWQQAADDGDHYRLAFDQPGSWSQKYNLVWDTLLGLNLFPAAVREKEIAFYLKKINIYGLPLDSRKTYTKLDWIFWTAQLADKREDFAALTEPVYKWVNEGVNRVPLGDWYETTDDGRAIEFRARSVVGGLYLRLLDSVQKV